MEKEICLPGKKAKLGSMYFEKTGEGITHRKYCAGYCQCGRKIGLTPEEAKEFCEDSLVGGFTKLVDRIFKAQIIIP